MAEASAWVDVAKILVSGAVGGGAAIIAALVTANRAERQHRLELAARSADRWLQFVGPLAAKIIDAHETVYELCQVALDDRAFGIEQYERARRISYYLSPNLRKSALSALRDFIAALRDNDTAGVDDAGSRIVAVQHDLERALQLPAMHNWLQEASPEPGGESQ